MTSVLPVTLRANLIAASLASAPLFEKKTRVNPSGRILVSTDNKHALIGEYVSPVSGFWIIFRLCRNNASVIIGLAWPIQVTPHPDVKSRYCYRGTVKMELLQKNWCGCKLLFFGKFFVCCVHFCNFRCHSKVDGGWIWGGR